MSLMMFVMMFEEMNWVRIVIVCGLVFGCGGCGCSGVLVCIWMLFGCLVILSVFWMLLMRLVSVVWVGLLRWILWMLRMSLVCLCCCSSWIVVIVLFVSCM